jgi:hypothetical protein
MCLAVTLGWYISLIVHVLIIRHLAALLIVKACSGIVLLSSQFQVEIAVETEQLVTLRAYFSDQYYSGFIVM